MTLEFILIGAGVLLVLAGIFGGGFEVQEVKIPQLRGLVRFVAAIFGIGFVALGLSIRVGDEKQEAAAAPTYSAATLISSPVEFMVFNEMEDIHFKANQTEAWEISIDGKHRGTLTVSPTFPKGQINISVPKEGSHSFYLKAQALLLVDDNWQQINCYGSGMIEVRAGGKFLVEALYDEKGPCLATLTEK